MLSAGEQCIHKNEIIEKTWRNIMIKWINKCVKPEMVVRELNEHIFSDVTKRYKNLFSKETETYDLTNSDIETFLERHYPKLTSREMKSYGPTKRLYIAMTAVLYHFCTKDKSGIVVADIFEVLEKNEKQMILNVCEGIKRIDVTVINVELAIKDAYDKTHMNAINQPVIEIKMSLETPEKEITCISPTETCLKKRKLAAKSMNTLHDLKNVNFKDTVLCNVECDLEMSRGDAKYLEEDKRESEHKLDNLEHVCNDASNNSESPEEDLDMFVRESFSECIPNCNKARCSKESCGDRRSSSYSSQSSETRRSLDRRSSKVSITDQLGREFDWKLYFALGSMVMLAVLIVILCSMTLRTWSQKTEELETLEEAKSEPSKPKRLDPSTGSDTVDWEWQCIDHFCVKAHIDKNLTIYKSLSRCTLLCMGPQLWPYPIGYTYYSQDIVALTTAGIEYKFQSVPSEIVHTYLAEAFKIFLKGLLRLEKIDRSENRSQAIDLQIKRISFSIEVENDPDPRLRLNTEESYMLNFETIGSRVIVKVVSGSFCGVRHGLETASQLILLDQATGYLLSYSDLTIKDAPSYKYRGLMLDTGRNYIPITDIMRTVDAMAACKLNTLHWRISSDTSFPLYLPQLPLLYEYGAYDRSSTYTKNDVKSVVRRAGLRGIRVLLEVTAPGPVGRAWSWTSEATCPKKTDNYTCDNILCTRLLMEKSVFDALEFIYSEILQMTGVDDIFHLSDGMFSMTNCYQLISDREGFLERALEKLKNANKGFLPKLPIIWYTSHLMKDSEARTWDKLGVQLSQWDPNPGEQYLGKFRVIHSTKWDLSCELSKHRCVRFKTWQEMYSWKSWRNIEVFAIEGGEAILWTDLVGPGNLDTTLWPRTAAVAERLWSDMTTNSTANRYAYVRLDTHRWRMLLRGIKVTPIWPAWCSFNPSECATKIRK